MSNSNQLIEPKDLKERKGLPVVPLVVFEIRGRAFPLFEYKDGKPTDIRETSEEGLPRWKVTVLIPWKFDRPEIVKVFSASEPTFPAGTLVTFEDLVIAPWKNEEGKFGFGLSAAALRAVGTIEKKNSYFDDDLELHENG